MKKLCTWVLSLAVLTVVVMSSAAQASTANVLYSETALSEGLWKYTFTVENTSSMEDSNPYLMQVSLDFEDYANVTVSNMPENWTLGTFSDSLALNETVETDYLKIYSDNTAFDVLPGALLSLIFTADYQIGEVAYEAMFSNHGEFEDWATVSGTASPVPVPGALWLLGSGLVGLAGIRRKMGR